MSIRPLELSERDVQDVKLRKIEETEYKEPHFFFKLPKELQLYCLQFFKPSELVVFSLGCKKFKSLTYDPYLLPILAKNLDLKLKTPLNREACLFAMQMGARRIALLQQHLESEIWETIANMPIWKNSINLDKVDLKKLKATEDIMEQIQFDQKNQSYKKIIQGDLYLIFSNDPAVFRIYSNLEKDLKGKRDVMYVLYSQNFFNFSLQDDSKLDDKAKITYSLSNLNKDLKAFIE